MVIRCIRAVAGNHMETVQVLLEFGADKGARNVRRAVHGTRSRSRAPLTRPVLTTQRYHKLPTALNQSTHMARLLQEHRACQALVSSIEPSLTSTIARRVVLGRLAMAHRASDPTTLHCHDTHALVDSPFRRGFGAGRDTERAAVRAARVHATDAIL